MSESRGQQIVSKIGNNGEAANPDDARGAIGTPSLRAPPWAAFVLVFDSFNIK